MRVLLILILLCSPALAQGEEIFLRTWRLVESNFYDPNLHGVDPEAVKEEYLRRIEDNPEAALRLTNESLSVLRASHTRLFHRSEPLYYELLDVFAHGPKAQEIKRRFDGELPWYVGILAAIEDGTVVAVVPGGPADRAGLEPGDEILTAAGAPFHPINSFRDEESTTLEIKRNNHVRTLSVTPRRIQPREAFLRSISDSAQVFEEPPYRLGYVRMWSYAGEPYQERLAEILKGKLKDTDGLILDLRGSWGGASPDFAELFLSQTELVMTPRGREPLVLNAPGYSAPIMLLSDKSVSSGKEILAYNLQKSGRASITGSPSRAAVLGGELHLLPHGYALYLARADVTVDGMRMERRGVFPDHYLPEEMHWLDSEDQLLRNGKGYLLMGLMEQDLKYRWFVDQQPRTGDLVRNVDRENQEWLKAILENHGWPSRERYAEAAQTAWLIAQHADNDLEFQKLALKLLTEAVEEGKAPAKERAYLQDRVLVNQGLPQIYGTQVTTKDGVVVPREVTDPERLDARRRSVGLGPMVDYLKQFENR